MTLRCCKRCITLLSFIMTILTWSLHNHSGSWSGLVLTEKSLLDVLRLVPRLLLGRPQQQVDRVARSVDGRRRQEDDPPLRDRLVVAHDGAHHLS